MNKHDVKKCIDNVKHLSTSDTHSKQSMIMCEIDSSSCPNEDPVLVSSHKLKEITVTDIIGDFGFYQCSLSIITFIRYVCVAMMTNTGPLIAPDVNYYCQLPSNLTNILNKDGFIYVENQLKNACQVNVPTWAIINIHLNNKSGYLHENTTYNCVSWTYNTSLVGKTMTDEFNLVCDRDWLRTLFQSIVSIGVVMASLFWGTYSDRHGRYYTMKICYLVALVSGTMSFLAPNFTIYAVSRSVCSLGDLGLVVSLATILVESVGNKHRGAVCIIVYTGWAIGVMIMPWITDYFRNYRMLMMGTIVLHLVTLPWLLLKKESVRWLLINKKFSEASIEVKRIVDWNNYGGMFQTIDSSKVDEKFEQLKSRFNQPSDNENKHKYEQDDSPESITFNKYLARDGQIDVDNSDRDSKKENEHLEDMTLTSANTNYDKTMNIQERVEKGSMFHQHDNTNQESSFGSINKVRQLFRSKELSITTLTLVWINFNSELLYMSFILINSDVGDDLYINYFMGGLMEILSAIISCIIISNVTRRLSLSSSLLCISLMCFTLAFVYKDVSLVIWLLSAAKLAISTLSSLIYVTTTEMFPTDLRQTGFGACSTFGSMGAVVAPFICSQLANFIGMQYVFILFSVSSATASISIPFFLRETKGVELADTLNELEKVDDIK